MKDLLDKIIPSIVSAVVIAAIFSIIGYIFLAANNQTKIDALTQTVEKSSTQNQTNFKEVKDKIDALPTKENTFKIKGLEKTVNKTEKKLENIHLIVAQEHLERVLSQTSSPKKLKKSNTDENLKLANGSPKMKKQSLKIEDKLWTEITTPRKK